MAPKIRKEYLWLLDYMRIAAEIYPPFLDLVRRITVRCPRQDCVQRSFALARKRVRGAYTITLMSHYWDSNDQKLTKETRPDLLDSLAHELAHVYCGHVEDHMNHTPAMYKLRNNLHTLFMDHIEKLGYHSEEESEK
jgi:hypothetical protein